MKIIIYLYYLFYIICGGYWHYFSLFFFQSNISNNVSLIIQVTETLIMLLAFVILIRPLSNTLHLCFFITNLLLDVYFFNCIKFESSLILTHFMPLFFFLLTDKKLRAYSDSLIYSMMLFVSVGFISSGVSKINSGWINSSNLVIYNYIKQFNYGYGFDTLMGKYLLKHIQPTLWKISDYLILLFEFSFCLVFIRKNYFVTISKFAVAFHILVFFTMWLGAFYPFILCYTLIINKLNGYYKSENESKIYILISHIVCLLFIINELNVNFMYSYFNTSTYSHIEYIFNAIALALFIKETLIYYKLKKYNNNISE